MWQWVRLLIFDTSAHRCVKVTTLITTHHHDDHSGGNNKFVSVLASI